MKIRNQNPEMKTAVIVGSERSQQFAVIKQNENVPMDANVTCLKHLETR